MADNQGILVLNAGSSSLKFALYCERGGDHLDVLCRGQVEGMMTTPRFEVADADGAVTATHDWPDGQAIDAETALRFVLDWLRAERNEVNVVAAGHRVVQGGARYSGPTRVDAEAIDFLDSLSPLVPQHQPPEVAGMRALARLYPDLAQVAVFDTSFHRTMPEIAEIYAVPKAVRDAGVRRWGYHGISYDYISRTIPAHDPEARRVVVGHLGSGASMCAMLDGKSIATTMGFSAVDGLPMGTRSGAIDPGALFYLLRRKMYDAESLEKMLYEECGLKGLSGISNDVRTLLASDAPEAKTAIDYFVQQIVHFTGAYAALLGGLDALVFTAGVGEHAVPIRAAVCERLGWLGLAFDGEANTAGGPRISTAPSRVRAWVIPTDEEIMIARYTLDLTKNR